MKTWVFCISLSLLMSLVTSFAPFPAYKGFGLEETIKYNPLITKELLAKRINELEKELALAQSFKGMGMAKVNPAGIALAKIPLGIGLEKSFFNPMTMGRGFAMTGMNPMLAQEALLRSYPFFAKEKQLELEKQMEIFRMMGINPLMAGTPIGLAVGSPLALEKEKELALMSQLKLMKELEYRDLLLKNLEIGKAIGIDKKMIEATEVKALDKELGLKKEMAAELSKSIAVTEAMKKAKPHYGVKYL